MESCSISCSDLRELRAQARGRLCIVGFGNRWRRDDGVGPWVVEGLKGVLPPMDRLRLLIRPQLDVDLLDEAGWCDLLILVDACVTRLDKGIGWSRIEPDKARAPLVIHSLEPEFLLGMAAMLHRQIPAAWQVSIQGEDFRHGEGLSGPVRLRARHVMADLVKIATGEEKI